MINEKRIRFEKLLLFLDHSSIVALSSFAENVPIIITLSTNLITFLLLCFFASQVHESAAETSRILSKTSDIDYPAEMIQFQYFLNSTKIALSGKGFFSITKGMMLSVSGPKLIIRMNC